MAALVASLALHLALVLRIVMNIQVVVALVLRELVLFSGGTGCPAIAVPASFLVFLLLEVPAALRLIVVALAARFALLLCVVPAVGISFLFRHFHGLLVVNVVCLTCARTVPGTCPTRDVEGIQRVSSVGHVPGTGTCWAMCRYSSELGSVSRPL